MRFQNLILLFILTSLNLYSLSDLKKLNIIDELNIDNKVYVIHKNVYGINEDLKKEFNVEKQLCDYSILVLSQDKDTIIQEVKLKDIKDKLSFEVDNSIFENSIKVKFEWDGFKTMPMGYEGYKYFRILGDGKLQNYFQYFHDVGVQDATTAQLRKIEIVDNKIELSYYYYFMIGFPHYGSGPLKVIYDIDHNNHEINLSNLESNVKKWSINDKGWELEDADPATIEEITFNESSLYMSKFKLNMQFRDMLKKYNFLY